MCPGLILGLGSEFWTQIWKVGFIYFIVTSFFFFPSQICSFFWLSSVALCEPLFLLFLYHPSDFSLSPLPCISTSYPFHSFFSHFYLLLLLLSFLFSSSIYPSSAPPSPGSPSSVRSPSCTPPHLLSPRAPPLSHWHHTLLPSPENHFKQPAPSKPTVSQPGSQWASQPAFCFDLKLLSSQSQGCFPLLIHIKDPLKLPKFAF